MLESFLSFQLLLMVLGFENVFIVPFLLVLFSSIKELGKQTQQFTFGERFF
jgi:hypothetical protein